VRLKGRTAWHFVVGADLCVRPFFLFYARHNHGGCFFAEYALIFTRSGLLGVSHLIWLENTPVKTQAFKML
jgi:hypothetical protein